MAKVNITNFQDADRRSATAGETMSLGMVTYAKADANGHRFLMKLGNGDSAKAVVGNIGVVFKVSTDPYQVETTTVNTTLLGDRRVAIASGDAVVEVRRGAILEYDPTELDNTLNPATAGTLPKAGDVLAVVGSKFCNPSAGSAIVSPVIGRCFDLRGGKVLIELVL